MTRTTIAWVPGYTMAGGVWHELWDALPGHEHVSVDLPGHGTEADTPMPDSLSGWAAHVARRMAATGARDLVGLSFGSSIALQVALEFPDQVDRLVLAAPTLSGRTDDASARDRYVSVAKAMFRGVSGRELAQVWMTGPPDIFTGLRGHPDRFEHVAEVISEHSFAELRSGAMATLARSTQTVEELGRVQAEVLVLSGTDDMPLFRQNAQLIGTHAPRAQLVELTGAGHLPLLEEPEASAVHLSRYLESA